MKLPIILTKDEIDEIINQDIKSIDVDIASKKVTINGKEYRFNLSKKMKARLLENIDEIDYTLKYMDAIEKYEGLH